MAKYQAKVKCFGYLDNLWKPGQVVVVPAGSPPPPAAWFDLIEADLVAAKAQPIVPAQIAFQGEQVNEPAPMGEVVAPKVKKHTVSKTKKKGGN